MNARRQGGFSLILAPLRGFCLLIFYVPTVGLPAKETALSLSAVLRHCPTLESMKMVRVSDFRKTAGRPFMRILPHFIHKFPDMAKGSSENERKYYVLSSPPHFYE
jgi:hypothetical protein